MAIVTIFALVSWWFTPGSAWLPKERLIHIAEAPNPVASNKTDDKDL